MREKIILSFTVLLVAFTLVVGCGKSRGSSSTEPNYHPIALGDKWTYNMSSHDLTTQPTYEITQLTSSSYSKKVTDSQSTGYGVTDCVLSNNIWVETKTTSYDANGQVTDIVTYSPELPAFPTNLTIGSHETFTYIISNSTEALSKLLIRQ